MDIKAKEFLVEFTDLKVDEILHLIQLIDQYSVVFEPSEEDFSDLFIGELIGQLEIHANNFTNETDYLFLIYYIRVLKQSAKTYSNKQTKEQQPVVSYSDQRILEPITDEALKLLESTPEEFAEVVFLHVMKKVPDLLTKNRASDTHAAIRDYYMKNIFNSKYLKFYDYGHDYSEAFGNLKREADKLVHHKVFKETLKQETNRFDSIIDDFKKWSSKNDFKKLTKANLLTFLKLKNIGLSGMTIDKMTTTFNN